MKILRALTLLFPLATITLCCAEPIHIYAGITHPVQYLKNEKASGAATVAIRKLMDGTGLDYQILMMNWAQAQKQMSEDKNGLIYAVARSPERESAYRWLLPLAQLELRLARLNSRPELSLSTFEDLLNHKMAVVRNLSTHHMALRAGLNESEHLLLVDSSSRLLRILDRKIVDFIFYEPSIFPAILENLSYKPDHLTLLDIAVPVPSPKLYLAANQALNDDIASAILKTHERLSKQPEYHQLLKAILPNSNHSRGN